MLEMEWGEVKLTEPQPDLSKNLYKQQQNNCNHFLLQTNNNNKNNNKISKRIITKQKHNN